MSDINSKFYRKCKRRLSRNSLFTSINIDNENEFIQIDEKSLLITGKNRNSKNNENTLSLKNSSDYEQKIADYFEINLSNERVRSLRNVLKEKINFSPRKRRDIDKIFIDALPNETKRILPAIRYNLIFDAFKLIINGAFTGEGVAGGFVGRRLWVDQVEFGNRRRNRRVKVVGDLLDA